MQTHRIEKSCIWLELETKKGDFRYAWIGGVVAYHTSCRESRGNTVSEGPSLDGLRKIVSNHTIIGGTVCLHFRSS